MVTKIKARTKWLWGDKRKGVSVYRLNYKTPKWRVALWLNGKLHHVIDYFTEREALSEGRAYVREYKRSRKGWWS